MSLHRSLRRDGDANLMLLAGIIITIAFIMTALTLEQVGSLERQAAAEPALTLAAEWRFIHGRLASNLDVSITETTSPAVFPGATFSAIAETFRAAEAEKGFDVTMRLAGAGSQVNKTEIDIVTKDPASTGPLVYGIRNLDNSLQHVWSVDGRYDFTGRPYDANTPNNDGLLMVSPCPNGLVAGACIAGVLVSVHLSDGASSLEEVMLFAVDQP